MTKTRKTWFIVIAITVLLIVIAQIYAIFSHGVRSTAMTWMFVPTLVMGISYIVLKSKFYTRMRKHRYTPSFRYFYVLATALLTNGMFIQGVLEIAGSESRFLFIYYGLSLLLYSISFLLLILIFLNKHFRKLNLNRNQRKTNP